MSADIDYKLLERYQDGELPDALRDQAEALLARSVEARQYLSELQAMGAALRGETEDIISRAPLEGLWDRIAPELEPPGTQALPKRSPFDALRDLWTRSRWETGLNFAMAAAAVLLCVWVGQAMILKPMQPTPFATETAEAVQNHTFVVESYDVAEGSTVVIDVDPEDPQTPAVVWHIVEDDTVEEHI